MRLRYSLLVVAFALAGVLGGCAGATTAGYPSLQSNVTPQSLGRAASGQDLLYISEYGGGVDIFSYPQDVYLGTLSGIQGTPRGECVDRKGDLFVVEDGANPIVAEYAHGGVNPIATLSDAGEYPYGCSVDPVTGNLAVSNEYSDDGSLGSVSIWKNATGTPATYSDRAMGIALWCGYDNNGNLFLDGLPPSGYGASGFRLGELLKGSKTFTNITVPKIKSGGNIQWDGSSLTIGDPSYKTGSAIYRVAISGSKATLTGLTVLKGSTEVFGSFINQGRVIGPDQGYELSTVQLWKYPAGGKPTATLSKGTYGFFSGPFGAAISSGSSR